jgi:hypothetical protein
LWIKENIENKPNVDVYLYADLPEHQSSPLDAQSLVFFFLDILLSVLEFTASDYHFGIFTIFLAVFYGLVFD